MSMENLSDYVKTVRSIAPAAFTGAQALTPTIVNCTGYSRARHVIFATLPVTGAIDCELTESATSGGTYALVASSGLTFVGYTAVGATAAIWVIDAKVNPSKPFQKLRGTAYSATLTVAAICDLYNGSNTLPPTQIYEEEVTV